MKRDERFFGSSWTRGAKVDLFYTMCMYINNDSQVSSLVE